MVETVPAPGAHDRGAPPAAVPTVGAAIPQLLAHFGVEVLFGIPGVHTLEVFRGLPDSPVRHVLSRNEQGSVFAADGYARVSGRPGVAFVIDGPGLTNAATAVAQAHHDSTPLLVLSAGPPRRPVPGVGSRLHQMPDQQAFMASITAWSRRVETPEELVEALSDAWSLFTSERPRPVHIDVPVDLLEEPAALPARPPVPAVSRPVADAADVRGAARLLVAARSPIVLLGGGAKDAGPEAVAIAEALGAPVVTTLNGKGAVDESHPLHLGTTLATEAVVGELEAADLVLAVGTEFCSIDYFYAHTPHLRSVIRVDVDPGNLHSATAATVALLGDAAETLSALAGHLPAATPAAQLDGADRAARVRDAIRWWPEAEELSAVLGAVGAALPEDAVVVVDSTQLGYSGQHVWPARRPRSWLVPAGWGTLGPALPMAVGAALGAPGRPVLGVVGDGGLLFTVGEAASAVALGLPITLVVWDNDGYGEMRTAMDEKGIPHLGVDGGCRDAAAVLAAFGWSVRTPGTTEELRRAVADGMAARTPTAVIARATALLGAVGADEGDGRARP